MGADADAAQDVCPQRRGGRRRHLKVGERVLGVGHGPAFKRAMTKVGLEGKPTATTAGKALRARLAKLETKLGGYPHDTLNVNGGKKKQTTRLIKVECAPCDYIARVTRKPLDRIGPPICPGCHEVMVEPGKEVQHPTMELSLKYATSTVRN